MNIKGIATQWQSWDLGKIVISCLFCSQYDNNYVLFFSILQY